MRSAISSLDAIIFQEQASPSVWPQSKSPVDRVFCKLRPNRSDLIQCLREIVRNNRTLRIANGQIK